MIESSHIKLNPKYLKLICILSSCIVPLMVTGPFLPDLLVSVLSLWFIYFSLKYKIFYIYRNPYFYAFIGFCCVCIISSLLSDDIPLSLKASLFYFRIGIFALLISYLIDQNNKILDYFYYSLIITFSALIIDGYIQYFSGINLLGYKMVGMRVSSFFGDELILGSFLARIFPLLFALFVARKIKQPYEVYGISILFILIDVLIFIAGERAAFVLLNLSTLFIIIFISKYKWLRLGIFVISIIIITFIVANDTKLHDRYVKSPIDGMGLDNSKSKKNMFTPAHDALIRTAWNMFIDKPILGHGPKLYRVKCKDIKFASGPGVCHPHPHNFYIQLLAETGIVGFMFLAGLFIYFCYLMLKHTYIYFTNKHLLLSDYQICLLAGLLITIWPITTSGNIFTNKLMLFYSLQMGFFRKIN
ncbi:O-antigen ligase family protein [Candidatus Pelagibacter sp.]|nr:O-antigen ligase family protein [Candidatus Pelagibacter sp.]